MITCDCQESGTYPMLFGATCHYAVIQIDHKSHTNDISPTRVMNQFTVRG